MQALRVAPPAAGAAAAAPAFLVWLLAAARPRPQAGERGIGPQLPRPNRVRVPTRRELVPYGIAAVTEIAEEKLARRSNQ